MQRMLGGSGGSVLHYSRTSSFGVYYQRVTMGDNYGDCPVCGVHKSLEKWHRPLPYKDRHLTSACSECYIEILWPFNDITED